MNVHEIEAGREANINRDWAETRALRWAKALFPLGNPFTGGPVKHTDSPGNFLIKERSETELEYVWFDIYGGPHIQTLQLSPSTRPGESK